MVAYDEFDDAEFAELFGAFDDVVASADLKQRTLAAVRGEEGVAALDATVVSPYVKVPDVDATAPFTKRGRATRPVRRRMNVGAIFAAVFAVLIVFGVASWFLPVSSVRIEQDEFVVDLGVNLYGVTVQATAEGDEGKAVLEAQPVTNLRRDEAERRLRSAFDKMRPESRNQETGSSSTDATPTGTSDKGSWDAGSGTGTYTAERPSGTDTTPTQEQPQQQQPQQQQQQPQQQNPNQGGQAPRQQAQPEGAGGQAGAGQPQGNQQPQENQQSQGQQPSTQGVNPGAQEPNQGNGGGQPSQMGQGGETQPSQVQTPQQQTPSPQPGQEEDAVSGGQEAPTINRNAEEQAPQTPQGTGDGGAQPAMPSTPSEGQEGDFGGGGEPQMTIDNGATPGDAGGVPSGGGEGVPSGGGDAGGPAGAGGDGM